MPNARPQVKIHYLTTHTSNHQTIACKKETTSITSLMAQENEDIPQLLTTNNLSLLLDFDITNIVDIFTPRIHATHTTHHPGFWYKDWVIPGNTEIEFCIEKCNNKIGILPNSPKCNPIDLVNLRNHLWLTYSVHEFVNKGAQQPFAKDEKIATQLTQNVCKLTKSLNNRIVTYLSHTFCINSISPQSQIWWRDNSSTLSKHQNT